MHQNITNYQYSNRKHRKTSTILHQHHKNIWHSMLLPSASTYIHCPSWCTQRFPISDSLSQWVRTCWRKRHGQNYSLNGHDGIGPRLSTGAIKILVGGFNPSEKYARQIGSFPRESGWKYKMFELPPPRNSKFQFLVQTSRVEVDTPVTSW